MFCFFSAIFVLINYDNNMRLKSLLVFVLIFISCGNIYSQDVRDLVKKANALFQTGNLSEASNVHEKIIAIDTTNFESYSWLGNYFYLQGKQYIEDEDKKYSKLKDPTRMQTAIHMDELKRVYNEYFSKAEPYVQKALTLSANDYLSGVAQSIELFKIRIGIKSMAQKTKVTSLKK